MVLIEAMARGVPALSVNVGGIPEVVGNQGAGKLVDLEVIEDDFVAAINEIRENYAAMSDKSRERVLELFTLEKLSKNYEKVYE